MRLERRDCGESEVCRVCSGGRLLSNLGPYRRLALRRNAMDGFHARWSACGRVWHATLCDSTYALQTLALTWPNSRRTSTESEQTRRTWFASFSSALQIDSVNVDHFFNVPEPWVSRIPGPTDAPGAPFCMTPVMNESLWISIREVLTAVTTKHGLRVIQGSPWAPEEHRQLRWFRMICST
jgi:hypothetical protein